MTQKQESHVAGGQRNQEGEHSGKGISGSACAGAKGREHPIPLEWRRASARLLEALSLPNSNISTAVILSSPSCFKYGI